jgi:hypothetical protein
MRAKQFLLAALLVATACSRSLITEQDGQGGVFSMKGASRGYFHGRAEIGQLWTGGGVLLCRSTPDVVARIVSIEPVEVTGDVTVDAIHVRTSLRPGPEGDLNPNKYFVNGAGSAPANARQPAGYLVPTACRGGPGTKVGEVMTTMTKTGAAGGMLQGLRVTYLWGWQLHEFVIPWTFGLCGTATQEHCGPGVGGSTSIPAISPA